MALVRLAASALIGPDNSDEWPPSVSACTDNDDDCDSIGGGGGGGGDATTDDDIGAADTSADGHGTSSSVSRCTSTVTVFVSILRETNRMSATCVDWLPCNCCTGGVGLLRCTRVLPEFVVLRHSAAATPA